MNPFSLESYSAETDLHNLLVVNEAKEGIYFEFKSDYTGEVRNKLGKHIAAFANSYGGLIAIGVEADNSGIARQLVGINNASSTLEDDVYRKVVSTVNPIPLFASKRVPLSNGKPVLLVKVEESSSPPHLFNGRIYFRPAAGSEPVDPENRAEIDRLYQKSDRVQTLLDEVINQTWFKVLNWTHPTAHLITCPVIIKDDLIPDFNSDTLERFRRVAEHLPYACNEIRTAANEFRCWNGSLFTVRLTRYGLLEALTESEQPESEVVFDTISLEHDLHEFLRAASDLYRIYEYSGHFKVILGVRQVKGKKTFFRTTGAGVVEKVESLCCEKAAFHVERETSLGGPSNVIDDQSRKVLLEGVIREYVANFGTTSRIGRHQIANMVYLEPDRARWR